MDMTKIGLTGDQRIALGDAMWRELADNFRKVLAANRIDDPDDRMQVWMAFICSQCGSMVGDVGKSRAAALMRAVLDLLQTMSANDAGIVVVHGARGPAND